MYNYYQIFDYENNRIGLYLHQFSVVDSVDEDGIDDRDTPNTLPVWAIALIVILCLIIVGIVLAIYLIKRRNAKLNEQLVEYNHNDTKHASDKSNLLADRNQL